MDPIERSLFGRRLQAICDEMGAVLCQTAVSPNIRDRMDFSCAVFDGAGRLSAQAAHIPVHLGSMAYAMGDLVEGVDWDPGDMLVLNDPYRGGTHLPDVTVIAPLFAEGRPVAFVANRAHHADIGARAPGSMPVAERLDDEGLVIGPTRLVRAGTIDAGLLARIGRATGQPQVTLADFRAQIAANHSGLRRLNALLEDRGAWAFADGVRSLQAYAAELAARALAEVPDGVYRFEDWLDDDGFGTTEIPIRVTVTIDGAGCHVDFTGTASQVRGNVNCPVSVTAAAVFYVIRCLLPPQTPSNAGAFDHLSIQAPAGCLVNAQRPGAVAAGNVETASRLVDVLLGALAQALPERIPAASQGTMNNVAMGAHKGEAWSHYETLAGGMGAGPAGGGLSGIHTHMTNTRNTPIEVMEALYPVRITRYALRTGSGGAGRRSGGDGIIRGYRFLAPAQVSILSERRQRAPWGLAGGAPGCPGRNLLGDRVLGAKVTQALDAGDELVVETPGGGGWGTAEP